VGGSVGLVVWCKEKCRKQLDGRSIACLKCYDALGPRHFHSTRLWTRFPSNLRDLPTRSATFENTTIQHHNGLNTKAERSVRLLVIPGIRHTSTPNHPCSSATISTTCLQTCSKCANPTHTATTADTEASCVPDIYEEAQSHVTRFCFTSTGNFRWETLWLRMEGRRYRRESVG
jgi:hypothetical protein